MDNAPSPLVSSNGSAEPEPTDLPTEGMTPPVLNPSEGTTSTLPAPIPQPPAEAKLTVNSGDLMEIGMMLYQEAEGLLKTGKKKKLRVRLGRKSIAELPLATGAIGVLVVAMAAVALTRLSVEVE